MRPIVTDWNRYPNFKASELGCRHCGLVRVDLQFMNMLQLARDFSRGVPFRITSGCRCVEHNRAVGGSANSDHITSGERNCVAVDIQYRTPRERFLIKRALFLAGFDRIADKRSDSIIHAGICVYNDAEVEWDY